MSVGGLGKKDVEGESAVEIDFVTSESLLYVFIFLISMGAPSNR